MNGLIKPWESTWAIFEEIGRGGQGIVSEVRTNGDSINRAVLKQIVERWRNDRQAQDRLRNEGKALATLNKLNARVPRLIDSFSNHDSSEPFLLMEYVEGIRFDNWLKSYAPVDPAKAATITSAVAETIAICHESKIGHRDLKPANIIFRNKDIALPCILDFGISFDSQQSRILTREGEMFWNEFIILPECQDLQGGHRDLRSDITALAGLFFTCLTGRPPIVLRDAEDRPPHRRYETLVRKSALSIEQGERLLWFFDTAFAFRIADRFQSMKQFDENLAHFADMDSLAAIDLFEQFEIFDQTVQAKDRSAQVRQLAQTYKPIESLISNLVISSLAPLKAKGAEVNNGNIHISHFKGDNLPTLKGGDLLPAELVPTIQITRKHFSKTACVMFVAFGVGMQIHVCAASYSTEANAPRLFESQLEWTKIGVVSEPNVQLAKPTEIAIVEGLKSKLAYELRKLTPD